MANGDIPVELQQLIEEYKQYLRARIGIDLSEDQALTLIINLEDKIKNSYIDPVTQRVVVSSLPTTFSRTGTFKPTTGQFLDILSEFDVVRSYRNGLQKDADSKNRAILQEQEDYKTYLGQKARQQGVQLPDDFGTNQSPSEALRQYDEAYRRVYGLQPSGYEGYDEAGNPIATGMTSQSSVAEMQRQQPKLAAAAQEQAEMKVKQESIARQANTPDYRQYNKNLDEDTERARQIMQPPPMKDISGAVLKSIGGIENQNLGQYARQNLGQAADEFERMFPGARAAWWKALRPYSPYQGQIVRSPELAQSLGLGNLGGTDVAAGTQRNVIRGIEQSTGKNLGDVPLSEDPLETYLKNYDWYKEFIKLPAAQRGYQPKRFAPAARWLTG